ncbi:MAG: M48 family metallopeptidase [Burkholderiales bacterium]|nr:M48 family metallopeptidase [Burkholderiales bacterium]
MTNDSLWDYAFDVSWFDGTTSRMRRARLETTGSRVRVYELVPRDEASVPVTTNFVADEPIERVRISSRIGNAPCRIEFPNGGLAVCGDWPSVERTFRVNTQTQWLPRLERASAFVAIALAGVLIALYLGYKRVIPVAADFAAQRIPPSAEAALGDVVLNSLGNMGFRGTRLSSPEQASIEQDFAELAEAAGLKGRVGLQFHMAKPNAFAVPGGTVLITDPLVMLLRKDRQMLRAVLAHELGHIAHRDTLRLVLASSASAVVVGAVAGDVSGVGALMTTLPSTLTTLSFVRKVEAEADSYAFDLLRATGTSPKAFADAMRRMQAMGICIRLSNAEIAGDTPKSRAKNSAGKHDPVEIMKRNEGKCFSDPEQFIAGREEEIKSLRVESGPLYYLNTHPIHRDRIAAAEAAAAVK